MNLSRLELRIPPPLIGFLFALAMVALAHAFPLFTFDFRWRELMAASLAGGGLCLVLFGGSAFRKVGTTFSPVKPTQTSVLVTTGLYRLSRNPMYVGMLLILVGWAFHLAGVSPFLLLPGFVAYMNRFQIRPEERALSDLFGDAFADYRRRTRRWL